MAEPQGVTLGQYALNGDQGRRMDQRIGQHNIPGQSRGIVAWLRRAIPWPGRQIAPGKPAEEHVENEILRGGPAGVSLPWFLPYFDDMSGETAEMRFAYRRMMTDNTVKAALLGKLYAVMSLDLACVPHDKDDEEAKEQASFAEWNYNDRIQGNFPEIAWSILSGMLIDGFCVTEKVWDHEETGRWAGHYVLSKLVEKDTFRDLVLVIDEWRNVVGVQGLRYNEGTVFSPADFVIQAHLPWFSAPTGQSDLRSVYSAWWQLDTVMKLRATFLSKRAMSVLVGTYDDPTKAPKLEAALKAAKNETWMCIPEGVRVEAVDIAGREQSAYDEAIRDLREEIFLGLQGATLQALTGGQGQLRGSSWIHADTASLFKWYLKNLLEAVFNNRQKGITKDLIDLNFVVSDYPKVVLSSVDTEELQKEFNLAMGVNRDLRLPVSKQALYEKFASVIVPPEDEEDALEPPDMGGGMMGGGFPPDDGGGGGLPFKEFSEFAEQNKTPEQKFKRLILGMPKDELQELMDDRGLVAGSDELANAERLASQYRG